MGGRAPGAPPPRSANEYYSNESVIFGYNEFNGKGSNCILFVNSNTMGIGLMNSLSLWFYNNTIYAERTL